MSALTFLYVVLPFPVLFFLHGLEEIVMAKRWLERHREKLLTRFPRFGVVIRHLLKLDTLAFAIAAAEEFVVLLIATATIIADIPYSILVWSGLVMAFALHLIIHVAQVFLIRSYVPGIVTSMLSLPYILYAGNMIVHTYHAIPLIVATLGGIAFMTGNLLLAHHLGIKLSDILHKR